MLSALPPHTSPAAAAAAAGASAGSVFVKRAGDAHARFAEVEIFGADTVTRLAERASLKRRWGVDAAYVDLFLVRPDRARFVERGDESNGVGDALFSGDKLSTINVVDGVFLLARLSSPPAAAPGECARARLAAPFRARRAWGPEALAGRARDSAEFFAGRSPFSFLASFSPRPDPMAPFLPDNPTPPSPPRIFCRHRRLWRRRWWWRRRRCAALGADPRVPGARDCGTQRGGCAQHKGEP